jgi:hypothetical protein
MTSNVAGSGTAADPWILSTPPGKSDFEAWRDQDADPAALVVQVGSTQLRYQLRCIDDLHTMLKERGDWMPLGNADEQKPAADGTVEAWGRSPANPVGGWYGLKKGLRGRFGNYVPPVLEALGLAVEAGRETVETRYQPPGADGASCWVKGPAPGARQWGAWVHVRL